ncbi:hypothetical protein RUND412_010279 [Rhizina undulata]
MPPDTSYCMRGLQHRPGNPIDARFYVSGEGQQRLKDQSEQDYYEFLELYCMQGGVDESEIMALCDYWIKAGKPDEWRSLDDIREQIIDEEKERIARARKHYNWDNLTEKQKEVWRERGVNFDD